MNHFLNPDINHPEWIIKRGKINKDDEIKIYKIFETFLDDLSNFITKNYRMYSSIYE